MKNPHREAAPAPPAGDSYGSLTLVPKASYAPAGSNRVARKRMGALEFSMRERAEAVWMTCGSGCSDSRLSCWGVVIDVSLSCPGNAVLDVQSENRV